MHFALQSRIFADVVLPFALQKVVYPRFELEGRFSQAEGQRRLERLTDAIQILETLRPKLL